jgi:hypothetical protein
MSILNPCHNQVSCLLGNLKLHWPLGLLLHYDDSRKYLTTLRDVADADAKQTITAKLASIAKLNNAKSRVQFSSCYRMRMTQIFVNFRALLDRRSCPCSMAEW